MDRLVLKYSRKKMAVPSKTAFAFLLSFAFAAFGHVRTQAEEILDYLPEDALGFVIVRDLGVASERFQKVAMSARLPLPAPLGYFKFATGIAAGLDEEGDMLVALIPGSRPPDPPEPMVLLPVNNYDEFAASVKAAPSGKVSNVKIAGEQVLVAKQGPFAMLMNPEHRESLELITSLDSSPIEVLSPWTDWLLRQQVALVVMPEGKEWIRESSQHFFNQPRRTLPKGLLGNPEIAGLLAQLRQGSRVYQAILESLCSEIEVAGYGIEIDEQANIRFGKRAILKSDFKLDQKATAELQLTGFVDQPYIFAGGTALPAGALEKLVRGIFQIEQRAPDLWDLEDLPPEQWQAHEDATVDVANRIESVRFLVLPGKKDEPLLSNVFGVLQVEDAAAFLESYKKQVEIRNQILAQNKSDIRLEWEITDTTITERPAIEEILDVAAAAAEPDVPIFNWMIEATLGEDGKLQVLWVATEENQIVCGICEKEDIARFMEHAKAAETGLHESKQLTTTRSLLPAKSTGQWFVSPQGCVQWINRVFDELLEPVFGFPGPEFDLPNSPPIGFTLNFPRNQVVAEIVWPVELTKALVRNSE